MDDKDPKYRSLGLAIKGKRTDRGISQEQLAKMSHLHRTYIGAVERGERNMSIKNLYAIAEAMGIKASDLMAEAEELEGDFKSD